MNSQIETEDILVDRFEEMAGGASNLVSYLAYGNGKGLFSQIENLLGNELTKELYSDNVSVERLELSTTAYKLKESINNNSTPKM